MAITGAQQPEIIQIDDDLRLRKYDGKFEFALQWYQDEETVYLVDGVRKKYTFEDLTNMYEWLNEKGELYFIEVNEKDKFVPIGDVTFWQNDMPIVIGDQRFRGKGIGKKVINSIIHRAKGLGFKEIFVNEIYDWNIISQQCFEKCGFICYDITDNGKRYKLKLAAD